MKNNLNANSLIQSHKLMSVILEPIDMNQAKFAQRLSIQLAHAK
jgi:hypothetical protein